MHIPSKNILLLLAFLTSCTNSKTQKTNTSTCTDTLYIHDTVHIHDIYSTEHNWQEDFNITQNPEVDSIAGKAVLFYIENKECSGLAYDFYDGRLRPSDNGATSELLKLAYSSNKDLRPFYRWILQKTIDIQDGALGEYTGVPARKYAETYPEEFFKFMDEDSSGQRIEDWIGSIEYSGFYDYDDWRKPKKVRQEFINKMKQNCKEEDEKIYDRIEKFGLECFKEYLKKD